MNTRHLSRYALPNLQFHGLYPTVLRMPELRHGNHITMSFQAETHEILEKKIIKSADERRTEWGCDVFIIRSAIRDIKTGKAAEKQIDVTFVMDLPAK